MSQTRHCQNTGLLLPEGAKHPFLSAQLLQSLIQFLRRPNLKDSLGIVFFLSVFFFMSFHFYVFQASTGIEGIQERLALAQLILVEAAFLGLSFLIQSALILVASLRSRTTLWNRLTQIDILLVVSLSLMLSHSLYSYGSEDFVRFSENLFVGHLCLQSWIILRMFEALILRKNTSPSKLELNKELHRDLEQTELKAFGFALLIVLLIFGIKLTQGTDAIEGMVGMGFSLLLGLAPLTWWKISEISRHANEHGVAFGRIDRLNRIKNLEFLRFHFNGVFTNRDLKLKDRWLDPSAAWDEAHLESLSSELAKHSEHPVSRCLSESLENKNLFHVRLSDLHEKPNLGLFCKIRDEDGQLLEICLSHFAYLSSAGHAFTQTCREVALSWQEKSRSCVFLSINQRIVAGFALSSKSREGSDQMFRELDEMKVSRCLMSSQNQIRKAQELSWNAASFGLLPFERDLQIHRWARRDSRAFEIRADWDQAEAETAETLVWRPKTDTTDSERTQAPIQIFSDKLQSLSWLLRAARNWSRGRQNLIFGPALACLVIAGLSSGILSLFLSLGVYSLFVARLALNR